MNREFVRIWRSVQRRFRDPERNAMSIPRMLWYYLLKRLVALSRRKTCIEVPFAALETAGAPPRIAVLVHCFYPELFPELLDGIGHISLPFHLYVSTDTAEKAALLTGEIESRQIIAFEVRLAPNRGRDIAPKYITFRDVYARCDYFLHLHSKRSPHGGAAWGDDWRRYLLHGLVGNRDIVAANLAILADPRVGLVFPEPFEPNLARLRWGASYEVSLSLARRLGLVIAPGFCPDYPAGSMFWGKASFVRPLLELNLRVQDFPPEEGQLDGGLNHAIERIVVPMAEAQGLYGIKVVTPEGRRSHRAVRIKSQADLKEAIALCLKNEAGASSPLTAQVR
jgi:lipopolysaccharide biosynthesis protein